MWSVISSLSGWKSDLWLGLKCLFNEQRLCPCRVTLTNEWVTVFLSLCSCLFIISEIHSNSLRPSKIGPFSQQDQGSSEDHFCCLAATLPQFYSLWTCLDFRSLILVGIQTEVKNSERKMSLSAAIRSFCKMFSVLLWHLKKILPHEGNSDELCQNSYTVVIVCRHRGSLKGRSEFVYVLCKLKVSKTEPSFKSNLGKISSNLWLFMFYF